ncbi:unnamed protein product [Timema podura]|uniref:MD-2-related lipid-recognition domain-containing protein n=1 Tax=Timema podura TaxID=61482 RepID=A0ABN7P9W1_TIMPD|nr:unnamed protein product [Timema podura]
MLRIILVTVLLASSAIATNFTLCTDGGAPPITVTVTGCAEPPCNFASGANISITVTFTVVKAVTILLPHALATVLGLTIEYNLNQPDACKQLIGSNCPLGQGMSATYQMSMQIPKVMFKVIFVLKFFLVDQSGERVTCFQLNGVVS